VSPVEIGTLDGQRERSNAMGRSQVSDTRMKIGGVLVSQHIALVSVQGAPHEIGIAGTILEALGESGINVEFISCCPDVGGGDTLCISAEMKKLDYALDLIEDLQERIHASRIVAMQNLCSVAVFGPHFREIPNVASQIFKALAEVGINILSISTSVSSVTCVFDESKLGDALASLRNHFEIP
jgi:aspartate kinase